MTNFNWMTKLKEIKSSVLKKLKEQKRNKKQRIKTEIKNYLYNQF